MDTAICPCCGYSTTGVENIDADFGFRRYKSGKLARQSWCRRCRQHGVLNFHEMCPHKEN